MASFSSYFFGRKDKIDTPPPTMSDPEEQRLATTLLTAQTRTRAAATQRSAAHKYHQQRLTELDSARKDWLYHQQTRTPTTVDQLESVYRTAQGREQAADNVRKHYDSQYNIAVREEQAAVKNLANWRSYGIAIVDQEKARKAEILRKAQLAAEVEARRRAAEMEAVRQRLQRERIEKERVKREERKRREEERMKAQQEESQRAYYEWKAKNAHKPFSQGGANLFTPRPTSTQAFATACTTWRTAVEIAFQDYTAITIFPEPPVSGACMKASCKAEKRALKACACDVQKALRVSKVDLKKDRNGWHPDKFSGVGEEVREDWQRMAKEVFQVVVGMYQGQARG